MFTLITDTKETNGDIASNEMNTSPSNGNSKSIADGSDLDTQGCLSFLISRVKDAVMKPVEGFHTVVKKRFHNGRFCLIMLLSNKEMLREQF